MARPARSSAIEAYFVKPGNDASHAWQPTHNLCDRPVPSVINSVSWPMSRYFPGDLLRFAVVIAGAQYGRKLERGLDFADFQWAINVVSSQPISFIPIRTYNLGTRSVR